MTRALALAVMLAFGLAVFAQEKPTSPMLSPAQILLLQSLRELGTVASEECGAQPSTKRFRSLLGKVTKQVEEDMPGWTLNSTSLTIVPKVKTEP